jgi:hypothetical protein
MPNEISETETVAMIATKFVDLALKHMSLLGKVGVLPSITPNETQTLFAIVTAAGFNPKEVRSGKLTGNYHDENGRCTGVTFPINRFCPLKVINQEDRDDYAATGWLDCAFRYVTESWETQKTNRRQLITEIATEIKRSVPLAPIQLTPEGDFLSERPPHTLVTYFVNHPRDDDEFRSTVSVHLYCGGQMNQRGATKTCHALVCQSCYLRVLFPKEVRTYSELRQALATK